MFKNLFFLFLLLAGITAAGIRFHPEAIPEHLHLAKNHFVRLDLKAGNFVVGEIIQETQDHVRLKMGNGKIVFMRSEILDMKPIPDEEIESGAYTEWILEEPKKPIFTQRTEDSILPIMKKMMGETFSSFSSEMMKNAPSLKDVDLTKSLDSKHKKEIEAYMQQAEQGK